MRHIRTATLPFIALALAAATPLVGDQQRERESRQLPAAEANAEDKLDLNRADVKALAAEPAIGPELAVKIVAARPFTAVDELNRIEGMNAERLEQIRAKVTIATTQLVELVPLHEIETERPDANTADVETLAAIPSIGPDVARAIVAARPFRTIDDLDRVQGISAERRELIRSAVTVVPARAGGEASRPAPKKK